MARLLTLIFVVLVIVAVLVFHLRNDSAVVLDYYLGSAELPFSAWLVLAFAAGAVCGVLACLPLLLRQQLQRSRLARGLRAADRVAGTAAAREPESR